MSVVFEKPSDLSGYLFRIVDNGGASADRYTVAFSDGSYLGMSHYPASPQGVSMWGEDIDPATLQQWVDDNEAVDLALGDLPERLVEHILSRNNEGLQDFLDRVEAKDAEAVAKDRDSAEANEGLHDSLGKGIYWTDEGYRIKLDGEPEDDRGPFKTAREAVLNSLPDQYALAGPEYHSQVDDLMRMTPSAKVHNQLEAMVEARREDRDPVWNPPGGM